jgi:hypothetical protein
MTESEPENTVPANEGLLDIKVVPAFVRVPILESRILLGPRARPARSSPSGTSAAVAVAFIVPEDRALSPPSATYVVAA